MGPIEIGILSGALYWAKAVTNPTIGTVVDTHRNHLTMICLLGVSSLLISLFYMGVDGFWALLIIGLLGGSLFSGITPVAEVISMDHASKGRLDYARVRLWGSISFMAMYVFGEVLKGDVLGFKPDPEIILWSFLGGLLITVASTYFAPHFEQTSHSEIQLNRNVGNRGAAYSRIGIFLSSWFSVPQFRAVMLYTTLSEHYTGKAKASEKTSLELSGRWRSGRDLCCLHFQPAFLPKPAPVS